MNRKQMTKTILGILLLACSLVSSISIAPESPEWGFFGHKRINRLAVLTLPPQMMAFFKPHIDYLTDHAVDPDMRRYASKHEGPRHFIDLDNYGPPFDSLPRSRTEAMQYFTEIWVVKNSGDTVLFLSGKNTLASAFRDDYKRYFNRQVLPRFYKDVETLDTDSLSAFALTHGLPGDFKSAFFSDRMSLHGVLPWNLQRMQRDLTEAFRRKDANRILRLSADMGHYIGDAHVPLHTTSNYNGQKTGQHGIHGFWESRIPELFADENYDYFVGKPEYIANTTEWFWNTVFDSHSMVDSVLSIELALRQTFPADRQMCPDMRLGRAVVAPCREFSAAYSAALNNMVERRMRAAIHAVSSAWYTAWVDAGQPDLSNMNLEAPTEEEKKEEAEMQKMFNDGKILGRPEEQ